MRDVYPQVDYTQAPWTFVVLIGSQAKASTFFHFFHLTYSIADGPHSILSVVTKDLCISFRFTHDFLSRCKFSTLTTRQPMVHFYLVTYSCFPLRTPEYNSCFDKNRTRDFRTTLACRLPTIPLGRLQGRHTRFVGDSAFHMSFLGAPLLVGDTAEEVVSSSATIVFLEKYIHRVSP